MVVLAGLLRLFGLTVYGFGYPILREPLAWQGAGHSVGVGIDVGIEPALRVVPLHAVQKRERWGRARRRHG